MVLALAGCALLTLSAPLAAVASAVVLGFAYGPVNPVSTHILARVTTEKSRPLFFSIKQTGMPAGAAIAGVLLPIIVAAYDWRAATLTAGVMATLVALFIQPLRPRLDAIRQEGRKVRLNDVVEPLKLVWQDHRLRCLAVVCFTYSGVQVTIMTFYVVYLTATLAMSLTTAGLVFTFLQAGAIIGRLVWGAIADRYYPAGRLLAWLGIATGAITVTASLFGTAWPLWAIVLTSFLLGATCAGWNGLFFSELVKYAPPQRTGEAASGAQFITMSGVAAVPPLFGGIVVGTGGYEWPFLVVALAMAAAAVHHRAVFR
ncbi:MAG: MFS transporter, partial [Alphaproteobacteria bacterium]|nr:MFS transporter [Alphaproteobacteria bacterium]